MRLDWPFSGSFTGSLAGPLAWFSDTLALSPRDAMLIATAVGLCLLIGLLIGALRRRRHRRAVLAGRETEAFAEAIAMRLAANRNGRSAPLTAVTGAAAGASHAKSADSPVRIMLFIDYPNFLRSFRNRAREMGLGDPRLDWSGLPPQVLSEIAALGVWPQAQLRFMSAHVYDSYIPFEALARNGVTLEQAREAYGYQGRAFLLDTLALVPGYEVHIFDRVVRYDFDGKAFRDPRTGLISAGEKGVDTSLVADMVALAATGAMDVAVILSDDTDCIPAIETLQRRLGVPVVQMGFYQRGIARRAAWRHVTVDRRMIETLSNASRLGAPVRLLRRAAQARNEAPATRGAAANADKPAVAPQPGPAAPRANSTATVKSPPQSPLPAKPAAKTTLSTLAQPARSPQPPAAPAQPPPPPIMLPAGEVHRGAVSGMIQIGLFVSVPTPTGPANGFVHTSQMELPVDKKPRDVFTIGQSVVVKVMPPDHKGRQQFTLLGVNQADLGVGQTAAPEPAPLPTVVIAPPPPVTVS